MKNRLVIFFIICFSSGFSNNIADSLKLALSYAQNENQKTDLLNSLASEYKYSNPQLNAQYSYQALVLAKKNKYNNGLLFSYDNLATYHLLRGNLDSAEILSLRAFELAKKGKNKRLEGLQYNILGLIYLDKGDYSTSIQYLKNSIDVLQKHGKPGEDSKPVSNLGLCYKLTGQHQKAIELYEKSLEICRINKNELGIATNLSNLGVIYEDIGSLKLAIEHYFNAMEILERINDKSLLASLYLNISSIQNKQGEWETAMGYCVNAQRICIERGDTKGLVNALTNIGSIYNQIQKADSAIIYFEKAYELAEKKGFKPEQATLLFNIGTLYFHLEQYKNALNYIEKSATFQYEINDRKGLVNSKIIIAGIKIHRDQINVAIILLEEAMKISFSIGYFEGIKESSFELAHALEKLGKKELAFDYLNIHSQYKDSIMDKEKSKLLSEMQIRYKLDEIKKKNELLKKEQQLSDSRHKNEQQRNKTIIYTAIGGLLFLFTLAIMLFGRNQLKKRANRELLKRNSEIELQRELLHKSHKIITDSIQYAKKIQESILPSNKDIERVFPESFVFFRPKDVVSGDFYWFSEKENMVFLAIVDCTGHGVPGAFMSMIGHTLLSEIVNEKEIFEPSEILYNLNKGVIKALKQGENADDAQNDGMVISLLKIDKNSGEIFFAGANNSIFLIKNRILKQVEGDIFNIGGYFSQKEEVVYNTHKLEFDKGTMIYLFTDGYKDQFGGEDNSKYMASRFENLLVGLSNKSIKEQLSELSGEFDGWVGNSQQMDDVLVFGIRV
ncbi:MAG: tetratricopeptide repeat protein [Bacteroidales bacterium]|nr:tetratricopeptide repeat protein [Bacteroidales bacterium]